MKGIDNKNGRGGINDGINSEVGKESDSARVFFVHLYYFSHPFFISGDAFAKEKVTVIAEDDWYPYSGVIKGKAEGFAVDVVRAAFEAVDVEVEFLPKPYSRCVEEVKNGLHLACFDTTRTEVNETTFLWPRVPMFVPKILIYARADSKESHLTSADLAGKRVGVTNGYEYGNEVDTSKTIIKDAATRDDLVLKKLVGKRTNYALVFEKVADYLIRKHELTGKVKAVGKVWESDIYLSFSKTFKDSSKYLELFNKGFDLIKKNGTFQKIETDWNNKIK